MKDAKTPPNPQYSLFKTVIIDKAEVLNLDLSENVGKVVGVFSPSRGLEYEYVVELSSGIRISNLKESNLSPYTPPKKYWLWVTASGYITQRYFDEDFMTPDGNSYRGKYPKEHYSKVLWSELSEKDFPKD
jgi:hypothetical protein